jgi:dipeptidyl aminopeptidase/acylaminoacyl peptidase
MARLLLILLFTLIGAGAQTARLTEKLGHTVLFDGASISPDGNHVAWTQTTAAASVPVLYVDSTAAGSRPAAVRVSGKHEDSDPAWSPDSAMVAFFSKPAGQEQVDLWTAGADGSGARQRTHLKGYAARPHWSHDGQRIAFLFIDGAGGGGPLLAAPAMTGVLDEQIHNQRIAVLDLRSGSVRMGSDPKLHVYDFDWSPDDHSFAATAAPGPGDNNWWIAQVYRIDSSGGEAKSIYKPKFQVAVPRWSPDGKNVAFVEGLMSDEGFHGGDLYTVPASGGDAVNRTAERQSSVSSATWTAPDRVLLTEWTAGGSEISELNLADGSVREVWRGDEDVHSGGNFPNLGIARDGKTSVVARSSFNTPPDVWAGPIGKWRQLTHANDSQSAEWGAAESLEWISEGMNIQGWLLTPKHVQPGVRHPMIVVVHGGPSGVVTPGWPEHTTFPEALAAQGYYVLLPNPRGSYGRGESFTRANVKDFGGGDLRDILAGVDAAIAKYPIDPERLGLTGWSYGGFMTMFALTQTNRFHAAMAGAGIANWQSYYGENLIDQWMIPFFGASVYDDPAVYAKSSAINFIKNVKTPTLIQVGERDAECPAPQSFEFWHALRTLGVPTELVVYAGEGHMFVKPKNRVDMQDRTIAWFDKYLKAEGGSPAGSH